MNSSGTNGNVWDTSTVKWINGAASGFPQQHVATRRADASNNVLAYNFWGGGALAGARPLTKTGTLCVNNVTGSGTGTGDVEFFSGSTRNGIIGSSTTIDNGAILSPGNRNGMPTISNNLTLNDSSLLQFGPPPQLQ